MGRLNRSHKRRNAMNRIKRVRNAAKELVRLKKTLGLIDSDGNEIMKEVSETATIVSSKDIKKAEKIQENQTYLAEIEEEQDKGENIEVVNTKNGRKHTYNTKTMKDEYGNFPPWYKPKKTGKKLKKLNYVRAKRFKQKWTTINIPL